MELTHHVQFYTDGTGRITLTGTINLNKAPGHTLKTRILTGILQRNPFNIEIDILQQDPLRVEDFIRAYIERNIQPHAQKKGIRITSIKPIQAIGEAHRASFTIKRMEAEFTWEAYKPAQA